MDGEMKIAPERKVRRAGTEAAWEPGSGCNNTLQPLGLAARDLLQGYRHDLGLRHDC